MMTCSPSLRWLILFLMLAVPGLHLTGCAGHTARRGGGGGDYITAYGTGAYRPVETPGMQRRRAQEDAEAQARRHILNEAGRTRLADGRSLNEAMATNPRMRSEILNVVRTSEVTDWKVHPEKGMVEVWLRLDRQRLNAAIQNCT